jgi:hypothetical protein
MEWPSVAAVAPMIAIVADLQPTVLLAPIGRSA